MTEGEYYNCFGLVYLDTDASKIKIDKNVQDAFLHEDVHFIQNFCTLYGVNKSIIYMSILVMSFEFARQGKKNITYSDEEDMVKSHFDIIKGDAEQRECHLIEEILLENQFQDYYGNIPKYGLGSCNDTVALLFHNKTEKYNFGGEAISESVAYIFEKLLFNSNDYQGHQLPYNACELVYEYYFHKRCDDYPALLLTGYLSLMTENPGITFIEAMQVLKEGGEFSTATVKEVLRNVSGISDAQVKSLYERIDRLFPLNFDEAANNSLFKKFKQQFISANIWLKEKYRNSMQQQKTFTDSLIQVIEIKDSVQRKKNIECLLAGYGKPLVYDKKGNLYDQDESRVMLLGPIALQQILVNNEKMTCPFFNICKKYGGTPDRNCLTDFSMHISDTSVCIIRYYMYQVGLGGLKFSDLEY